MSGAWARSVKLALLCAVVSLGGAGCATTAMKGTPFFSGEYTKRLGPVEERVNAWPLLYYREPALSVLWPLIDYTDDYFAFRPLFSVYGLDRERQEYNVLWPLMHFEEGKGDNWILPFFWGNGFLWTGEDYVVGLPLYWHVGHPLSEKGGIDSLFPLWCYRTEPEGYDLHLMWPIMEFRGLGKEPRRREGWRLWPLYGSYREGPEHYRFAGWPLAHFRWNDKSGESTQCVLPLWCREKAPGHSLFLSLPYSGGSEANGRSWWLVPPLAYRDCDRNGSHTMVTPLYWQGRNTKTDTAWDLLLPLFYSQREPRGATFATLLGGYGRRGSDSGWFAVPALSGGWYGKSGGSTWILGGLGYRGTSESRSEWHVFPLCRSVTESNRWFFLSLPWSGGGSERGDSWSLVPPLWFHSEDAAGALTVTPLYMSGSETGGEHREWSALMPLYYRRTSDRGSSFVTLLGGRENDKVDGSSWMLYPLLTGGRLKEDDGSLWVLGPMFHARWGKGGSSQYLFPVYYWNGANKTFVSPVYAHWQAGETGLTVVPPLLTVFARREGLSDLWTAGGLVRWSWGKDAGERHVLPLYMGDVKAGWHVTPLYASWLYGGEGHGVAVPALLSWYMSRPGRSDLWIAGPLMHFSRGEERGGSHVFPLAYWDTRTSTYVSPFVATWSEGPDVRKTLIPPLLGYHERVWNERDLWLALGLFHSGRTEGKEDSGRGHLIPLYLYDEGMFLTPIFGWNSGDGPDFFYPVTPLLGFWRNEKSGMWLFPLFSRCRDVKTGAVSGNVLWGMYRSELDDGHFTMFPLFSYRRWDPPGTNEVTRAGLSEGCELDFLLLGRYSSLHSVRTRYVAREGTKPVSTSSDYRESSSRFFPLWWSRSVSWNDGEDETSDLRLLLFVYDHRREHRASPPKDAAGDYVRSRILYHFWHYERVDDAVSVDAFPAITYDRRGESLRKVTFFWRLFRYQRSGADRAVDLLFLPVWRTSWVAGDLSKQQAEGEANRAKSERKEGVE